MTYRNGSSESFDVRRRGRVVAMAVTMLTLMSTSASAQTIGTLTLDSLSFISFGDQQTFSLPAGSTLQFQFGTPSSSGSIPFTIAPGGLSILPIDIPGGAGSLQYGLAGTASGVVTPATDGHKIQFSANVTASVLNSATGAGTYTYPMTFTTETASAPDALGQETVERTGVRLVDGVWYLQIVAATTNKENAYPAPGTAVYSVLSGQFDQLPIGP